jgi:hypothetical protein
MWCTAGFFHAAGYAITADGATRRLSTGTDESVFSFDPIRITSNVGGQTQWVPDLSSTQRYVFHVRDTETYGEALTQAMKGLLLGLP